MNKALALLVALAAGARANVCNSACDWNALAADQEAPTATCGGRITWLQNNRGLSSAAACDQVADEFPSECGSCAGDAPAPAPVPPVQPGADLEVATFNLYEWHVGANNRWGALYDKIQSQSFDIIGFQEATGVANVINSVPRMNGWSYYEPTSIGGYNDNPAPIAWDDARFTLLASGWREVGSDQWGARGVAWVRLRDASSGSTIFFANTHGPLGSCSSTLGDNWLRVVTDNIVQGDMLIYVGDWNCGLASAALNVLTAQYTVAVDGGIDIIFTNGVEAAASRVDNGYPSDHPFVAATFAGAAPVPAPTPRLRGTPSPKPTVRPTVKPTAEPTEPAVQYKCGVSTCTDAVWDTYVQGPNAYAPCGGRIEWVEANMGMSEADACQFVGEEFPEVCGPCAPRGVEVPEPTPRPTPKPTIKPTAPPTREPTKEPTKEPTRAPTPRPSTKPTVKPTAPPTREPTKEPTRQPTDAGAAVTSFGVNYATGLMDNPPRTFDEHLEFARKAAARGLCKIKLWTCDDVELFEALQQAYDEAGLLEDCLEVMIHVPNGRVAAVANEAGEASDIIDIVAPYSFIKSVVVGNELDFASTAVPGDQAALDALPRALENMKGKGLLVATAFSNALVTARNGDWSDTIVRPERQATVRACLDHMDYFMFNPYPIFAYTQNSDAAWQDWVLGDGAWPGSTTSSILESQLGNMRKALRDLSSTFGDMPLTVGETGWASCGTDYATVANSRRYYENMLGGLDAWTTAYNLVPGQWYLFELFDEKRKPGNGMERCFGLLNQDGSAKPGLTEYVLADAAAEPPAPGPAPVECTEADTDAWGTGQYESCCDGLEQCTEPRDPSSPYFSQYPTIEMCRDSCDEPVPSPTARPVPAPTPKPVSPTASPACTAVDEDPWTGGSYTSCCDGLSECTEPRDPSSPYFSQYPTIQMCRTACAAETRRPTRQPTQGSPSNGGTVVAMSYNTEYTGYSDGRVPGFGAKISEVAPDVVGLQECQNANALAAAAPGYTVLGGTGPQNYILYDGSHLEGLESGWMDVPRDCYAQRTVTWGKFKIRATGDEFWFFNTHLPHNGCAATDSNTHAGIARQLVDKRNELGAGGTPTIVVGDCNPFASNGASEGSFESNLADRGIPLVYVGTGAFGGYGYLDKIFATTEWTKIDASDRGTGGSDHPAISASLRL